MKDGGAHAVTTFAVTCLIAGLLAQAPAPPPGPEGRASGAADDPAARLAVMKRSLATFAVHPADDRTITYRLQPEPIFRFTNPVGATRDGAIFFWLDERDRPAVAVQVFLIRSNDIWIQEFS